MESLDYEFEPLPTAYMLNADVPEEMVRHLNGYLDRLREDDNKQSNADTLVGQISHGEQLRINHKCKELKEFNLMILGLGREYIKRFSQFSDVTFGSAREPEMCEVWSVHSYAGDYNPIHDHGTQTLMGISFTMWTKVPNQITETPLDYKMYNASRHCDGNLIFRYGETCAIDPERLKPSQQINVIPSVGKLLMFPSWLNHMVYPFEGKGERRTIAGNLNVWAVAPNGQKFASGAH
jgi:hypothetical protein